MWALLLTDERKGERRIRKPASKTLTPVSLVVDLLSVLLPFFPLPLFTLVLLLPAYLPCDDGFAELLFPP